MICSGECRLPIKSPPYAHRELLDSHNNWTSFRGAAHTYGFVPHKVSIDTLHLSQVARAGEWEAKEDNGWRRIRHSLKGTLLRELGVKLGDKTKYQRGRAWQGDLTEEHAEYASNDVIYLKPLAEKLLALLKERGLE